MLRILLILPFNIYGGKYNNTQILKKGGEAEIPLGICYIKAYLKSKISNIKVKIYDSNIDAINYIVNFNNNATMNSLWKRVKNEIETFLPDIVGVSVFSYAMASEGHKIVAMCKKLNKNIITVMGGPYPTLSSDIVMEDNNVDIVVLSEGELVFSNLIKSLKNREPLGNINGIVYRDNGNIKVNPLENKINDLDTLPFPDLDDLPVELYGKLARSGWERVIDNIRPVSLVSSRGCVYQCGFCATKKVWGNLRCRSARNVIEEIKCLKNKYNINFVKFNDDLFTYDSARVIDICDSFIKERIIDHWGSCGETVKSLKNKQMVKKMIESGYYVFSLAIESGCSKTLKIIKKPLQLEMVNEAINNLRQYKEAYIGASFIVGFPFETKEDIQETYNFAATLDVNWVSFNMFTPFPKTDLYDYCIEENFLKNDNVKYGTLQNTSVLSTPNFDKEWLSKINYYNNLKVNFIGNYSLKIHNYDLAVREFNTVLHMVPDHAFAILYLGYCQEMLGNDRSAKLNYEKAKEIFKKNSFWSNYLKLFEKEIKEKIYYSLV